MKQNLRIQQINNAINLYRKAVRTKKFNCNNIQLLVDVCKNYSRIVLLKEV